MILEYRYNNLQFGFKEISSTIISTQLLIETI